MVSGRPSVSDLVWISSHMELFSVPGKRREKWLHSFANEAGDECVGNVQPVI